MFDLDGTLVDTMGAFADLAAFLMQRSHGDDFQVARQSYLDTSGVPFAHQLEIIHANHPKNASCSREFEIRKQTITSQYGLDARTLVALNALRNWGVKLTISSNASQYFVDSFVQKSEFAFDAAMGFDPTNGSKKGMPHFNHIRSQFNVSAKDILFVGDSIHDGHMAAECNVGFVGRIGTFSRATLRREFPTAPLIEEISEIAELLRQCKQSYSLQV